MRRAGVGLLVLGLVLAGAIEAGAHDAHQTEGMDDQLVSAGQGLMVGSFDAPQEGPLLVVPYVDGPLPCGGVPAHSHLIPVGNGTAVSFVANDTHVQANLDVPPGEDGFVSFALDTDRAHRTMMLMLEHAIAMHAMGAAVLEEDGGAVNATFDDGMMGVPYLFPDAGNASRTSRYFLDVDAPGGGIRMDYDVSAPSSWCKGEQKGHYAIRLSRDAMGEALADGAIVHGLVHWDHEVPKWLPRPIPTSDEFQVNLYLTRPSEDPQSIREALDPAPRAQNVASIAGLGVGMLLIVGRLE